MTVKFLLNRPNDRTGKEKKTPVAILARVSLNRDHRFVLTTKETILPKYWNAEVQRAKAPMTGSVELNLSLGKIEGDILQMWRENKTLSIAELKEKARVIIQYGNETGPVEKKTNDLKLFILDFIKKCQEGKITRAPATIQKYKAFLAHAERFSKEKKYPLSFEAVTLDFYYDFCAFLWDTEDKKETKVKKGQRRKVKHSDGTVGNQIKFLKMFMQEAADMGLHSNLSFKKKQFKKLEGETDSIYLTQDEIVSIYNLDLTEYPHLIESRDLFVFDCWVGLRYSDLTRIKPEHVNGNTIRIRTKKTGEDVVIPFHPIAQAIFQKYGGSLPDAKANASYNYDVKEIGQLADLKTQCQRRRISRGSAEIRFHPKSELITAHTARRSFATNCYKMGVPTRSIMAITGHKTEKAFNKYIKLSKEEHSAIVADIFQKQTLMKIA